MKIRPVLHAAILFVVVLNGASLHGEMLEWYQTVTAPFNRGVVSTSVVADGQGYVYISGYTYGDLAAANQGGADIFLAKYDENGTHQWTRQVGTSGNDESRGISLDGAGGVYISGFTFGLLYGNVNFGDGDAFVSKYDTDGNHIWGHQFGTVGFDTSRGIAADGSNGIYLSGGIGQVSAFVGDAFVRKYDISGTLQWSRQFGTENYDISRGIAADGSGSVYISGMVDAGTNPGDAFVRKYNDSGTLQWDRRFGTVDQDIAVSASTDPLGNVYVCGHTSGSLDGIFAGANDIFLRKYDGGGNLIWGRQHGTIASDSCLSASADATGVSVAGLTFGDLAGANAGLSDAVLARFENNGSLRWIDQFGTVANEGAAGVFTDGSRALYTSGYSYINTLADSQAFLVKYTLLPDADLNDDGNIDCMDVDSLVTEIVAVTLNIAFDLTGDGLVNRADLDEWRRQGGAANLPSGNPYPQGDANLDGTVDGSDFLIWNANRFTLQSAWCSGDFTADGLIDGPDFNLWNANKFQSAANSEIPEPAWSMLSLVWSVAIYGHFRWRHSSVVFRDGT